MGERTINTKKEAIQKIGELEEKFCDVCTVRDKLRREKGYSYNDLHNFCMTDCKIGRRIKTIGGIMQYGSMANGNLKAPNLTKEVYLELKDEDGMTDMQIREKFGISKITLTRRKRGWKLVDNPDYTIPRAVMKDLTPDKLRDLNKDYSDKEIADMYGVSRSVVGKRRKEWGIPIHKGNAKHKFKVEEYRYLSDKKSLKDYEIAELWEISACTVTQLKKEWGILEPKHKPSPEEAGLDYDTLLKLVPEKSDEEIGEMYGFTKTTIMKYRKSLGISGELRRPKNRIKPEHIKSLMDQGYNKGEMSNKLGIHVATLSVITKEFKDKNLL